MLLLQESGSSSHALCPKIPQITTAAGTIQQGSQAVIRTAPDEITAAAQSVKIHENDSPTRNTKLSPAALILDSSVEHLLVTTKIESNLAKTLLDQQTAVAGMISSKICTLHNLALHPLQTLITLQMTIKGYKGSISHYAKAIIDWLRWSKGRIFYVGARKDWDIILGSPALR